MATSALDFVRVAIFALDENLAREAEGIVGNLAFDINKSIVRCVVSSETEWLSGATDLVIFIVSSRNLRKNQSWNALLSNFAYASRRYAQDRIISYVPFQATSIAKNSTRASTIEGRMHERMQFISENSVVRSFSYGFFKENLAADIADILQSINFSKKSTNKVAEKPPRWSLLTEARQTDIGARWVERGDHFSIDASGVISDKIIADETITRQLHEGVRRRAREFLPIAQRLDNSIGWAGISSAAQRFEAIISSDTSALIDCLGSAYDSLLEVASFLDQDAELIREPGAAANPLEPDIRRALRNLVRTAAPWLRRFPTIVALDDECKAFFTDPRFIAPATGFLDVAATKKLISASDTELVTAVLRAGKREPLQAQKARTRGVHTVRNLAIASASIVAGFLSASISSDFATKSELVSRAGSALAEAEEHIELLAEDLQDDLRIALRDLIRQLRAPTDEGPFNVTESHTTEGTSVAN